MGYSKRDRTQNVSRTEAITELGSTRVETPHDDPADPLDPTDWTRLAKRFVGITGLL